MIRNSIFTLATLAVAATVSMTGAKADSYGGGYHDGASGYHQCHWERQKVFIGYDSYGNRRYKWQRVKVCG